MLKTILKVSLVIALLFGTFIAYKIYTARKERLRKESYYQNLKDTSSPTVTVLKDSIYIPYQDTKRTIHIYVPPEYQNDSTNRFPVIYMLDGESAFNDLENMGPEWEIDEIINEASKRKDPTAIVIGINQAKDRDPEYTPFINEDNPNAHGIAFANWVVTDLKNWVDTHYRTKRDAPSTTIGGISRSGMMAYFMLMKHPDIFGNALIQSPSMWVDHDRLMSMELSNKELQEKKIFVSVGEDEGRIMVPHAREIYKKFKNYGLDENHATFKIIEDEGHWHLTWRKSFAAAYPWLMK